MNDSSFLLAQKSTNMALPPLLEIELRPTSFYCRLDGEQSNVCTCRLGHYLGTDVASLEHLGQFGKDLQAYCTHS